MKRSLLLSSMVLMLAALPAASLRAATAPAATAVGAQIVAMLSKVTGIVRVTRDGSTDPAPGVAGVSLYAGDQVTTLNGRAEIQFPSGNTLRLKSDTVLRVVPPAEPGKKSLAKTFAFLIKGSVNALVRSVTSGEGFAIRSGSAVASVKGTDFIFDGSTVLVRDEGDSQSHAVALSDAAELHTALVGEGMTAGVQGDGSISDPHTFDPAELAAQDQEFASQPQGGAQSSGDAEAETAALRGEMREFAESDDLAQWSDFSERATDLEVARVVKDRHGEWVRMEEQMLHPAPDTVKLLVLNQRDGGPNKGVSIFTEQVRYNKALTDDNFANVYRYDYTYLQDPNTYPEYYKVNAQQVFKNPHGDLARWNVDFGAPVLLYDYAWRERFVADPVNPAASYWMYDTSYGVPYAWGQSEEDRYYLGSLAFGEVLKEHYIYSEYGDLVAGWYAGVTHTGETYPGTPGTWETMDQDGNDLSGATTLWAATEGQNPGGTLYPYDPNYISSNPYYDGNPGFDNPDFGGGFTDFVDVNGGFEITQHYADDTYLTQRIFFVDDEGQTIDWFGETFADRYNIEVEFEASEFSHDPSTGDPHSIDLVVDPQIWESGRTAAQSTSTDVDPNPPQ